MYGASPSKIFESDLKSHGDAPYFIKNDRNLFLQLVAALIRDDTDFQGNVGNFLHQRDWLLIRDIERLIDEMIARLSEGKQTCLGRISVYQTSEYPLSFAGISAQMPEVSKYELKENIIQALKRR